MADINNSILFQKKKKNPLDKIKSYNKQNNKVQSNQIENNKLNSVVQNKEKKINTSKIDKPKSVKVLKENNKKKLSVGAPDKFLDKALKASSSVKLSAVSNSILKILTEKYDADKTKDEIIRKALNEYIVTHLEKDDRIALLMDLEKDLKLYREKHPTLALVDEQGNLLKTTEEVEVDTINMLKSGFKLE